MADYYEITVTMRFGVVANSKEEAVEIAELEAVEGNHELEVDASLTVNQSDELKRSAVNNAPEQTTRW